MWGVRKCWLLSSTEARHQKWQQVTNQIALIECLSRVWGSLLWFLGDLNKAPNQWHIGMLTDGRGKVQCQRDYISAGREQMAGRWTATCAYSLHSFVSIIAPAVSKVGSFRRGKHGHSLKEKISLPSCTGSVTETLILALQNIVTHYTCIYYKIFDKGVLYPILFWVSSCVWPH